MELQLCLEKEQFSSLNAHQYSYNYSDSSSNMDSVRDMYDWEMENEKEINGDLALIPELSDNSRESMNKIIDSPPTVDLHRLMNELHDFISIDPVILPIEENFMHPLHDHNDSLIHDQQHMGDLFNITGGNTFDITEYLTDEEPKPKTNLNERKPRAGMKKIDLKAQKYIVDDDDSDESTASEEEDNKSLEIPNTPALEACDLFSLLEQFEATEMPASDVPAVFMEENTSSVANNEQIIIKKENNFFFEDDLNGMKDEESDEDIKVDVETIKLEPDIFIKKETIEPLPIEEIKASYKQNNEIPHHPIKIEVETPVQVTSKVTNTKTTVTRENRHKTTTRPQDNVPQTLPNTLFTPQDTPEESGQLSNRKVLNELPQDLISRIKESRKRKTIAVIPPIPAKKRGGVKVQENAVPIVANKVVKVEKVNSVTLDHDYCSKSQQEPIKIEPPEEDERTIIMKQPMVKNADGKLMVSLLKVNTIHGTANSQKKKLDIEEYKKRRKVKPQCSQSNSTSSSNCGSPLPEDETTRIQKHQEKLMRMAMEVLNTRPKSEKKEEPQLPVVTPVQLPIPVDMEKKTFVSIGVNTDFKICKNLDPVTPVQQLEEIKPLLEKASDKFNCNSLITSLIENIPKVINNTVDVDTNKTTSTVEHGEDKTIVYLPKNRVPTKTKSVEIQTNISLIRQTKEGRYRRRRDSSSSSSSSSTSRNSKRSSLYSRRRNNSNCSECSSSKSSYYTSRSNSRSRSRSRTPPRYAHWEQERFREVEERRVVYVGRISGKTTKDHLRERFERFGPITNISLHFRDHGYLDNYGFVTFANQYDAFEAIEHANDDPHYPKYDLSFGGRRQFCITSYSDLDNMRDETTYYPVPVAQDSFDALLKEAQEKLRRRKF